MYIPLIPSICRSLNKSIIHHLDPKLENSTAIRLLGDLDKRIDVLIL